MFKKIPGNGEYEMNYEGNVRKVDGSECDLNINDGFITLEMYGTSRRVCIEWLKHITMYELNLPNEYINELFKTEIVPIVNHLPYKRFDKEGNLIERKRPDKIIRFNRPLIVNGRFSVIPSFPKYAISKEGEIVETLNPKHILNLKKYQRRGYFQVIIYDPFVNRKTTQLLHRLLAMAWLSKDYSGDKTFINHKDGNRLNNNIHNLEWCNPTHNCNHAFDEDLRSDNKPCKIRDRLTGEVKEFRSLSKGNEFLGRKKGVGVIGKNHRAVKIYNDRYEVRMEGDDKPWLYENVETFIIPGRYTINIVLDGENRCFTDVRTLIKHYKLWNIPSQGIDTVVSIMKERYPGIKIDVVDNHLSGPYQSLHLSTKEVRLFDKMREMASNLKIDRSTITKVLRSKEPTEAYGYSFRVFSNDPWPESFKNIARQQTRISVVNSSTNEKKEFDSINGAARFLKVDKNTVKKKLETLLPINGFEILKVT